MPKTIAIIQSNYIPWKGYFDLIGRADEFVIYDHVQFTKNDWRNRNKIKTKQGPIWLTIPILQRGNFRQSIEDARTVHANWRKKHWKALEMNYAKAPFFDLYAERLKRIYLEGDEDKISSINYGFITEICRFLNIDTKITFSRDYELPGDKTGNLVAICMKLNGDVYLSGPSAKAYLNEEMFSCHGIEVRYADYSNYKEYSQLYPPFEHNVSVLDLLFCEGPNAINFMKFPYEKK